jgi:enamine deaminase RidA (YjgF/YER057c/UK114 family)
VTVLQPPGWLRPKGYACGVAAASGTTVFVSGQIGWDEHGRFASREIAARGRRTSRA